MNRKKCKVIHQPKKVAFSGNDKVNSSLVNLSMNYKKQIVNLKANNSELAQQLNLAQLKLKATEEVVVEMQKTNHLKALQVIFGNLTKMAKQLRPFLNTLEQSINFCVSPDTVNVDTTILNPAKDVSATPPDEVLTAASGQSESPSPRHKMNDRLDRFPMAPILEQSSREGFQRVDLLDLPSRRKSAAQRLSNVSSKTKSKSRASARNIEETTSARVDDFADLTSMKLESPADCFVDLDRLPSLLTTISNGAPEIHNPCTTPVQMPSAPEEIHVPLLTIPDINLGYQYSRDDANVTLNIPGNPGNSYTEATKTKVKDNVIVLEPTQLVALDRRKKSDVCNNVTVAKIGNASNSKAKGIGKVLNKNKIANENKQQPSKRVVQEVPKTGVGKSTKIPKLVRNQQVASPWSKASLEQVPSSSSTSNFLPVHLDLEDNQWRTILRVSLASSNNVENDNMDLKNASPSAAEASVTLAGEIDLPKTPEIRVLGRRTKRLSYVMESDSSSCNGDTNSEDSDYPGEKIIRKSMVPSMRYRNAKRDSEHLSFFSETTNSNENEPSKQSKEVTSIGSVPEENVLPSLYNLFFKNASGTKNATGKSEKLSQAGHKPTLVQCDVEQHQQVKRLLIESENKVFSGSDTDDSGRTMIFNKSEHTSPGKKENGMKVLSRRGSKTVSYKEPRINEKLHKK